MTVIASGRAVVAAAGTPVRLSATSIAVNSVTISAITSNTNPVTIGGADVVGALATRKGVAMAATSNPITLTAEHGVDELGDVYVDAVTNGEGVTYIYTVPG
jgi:hypothetical protein